MPMQSDRFMDGELLLERFAFRLASATFGWSRTDWKAAGMARLRNRFGGPFRMPKRHRFKGRMSETSSERLKQGNTKLYGTCLRRDDRNLKQLTEGVWKSMWCFGGLVDEVEIRVWQSGGLRFFQCHPFPSFVGQVSGKTAGLWMIRYVFSLFDILHLVGGFKYFYFHQ